MWLWLCGPPIGLAPSASRPRHLLSGEPSSVPPLLIPPLSPGPQSEDNPSVTATAMGAAVARPDPQTPQALGPPSCTSEHNGGTFLRTQDGFPSGCRERQSKRTWKWWSVNTPQGKCEQRKTRNHEEGQTKSFSLCPPRMVPRCPAPTSPVVRMYSWPRHQLCFFTKLWPAQWLTRFSWLSLPTGLTLTLALWGLYSHEALAQKLWLRFCFLENTDQDKKHADKRPHNKD